jgi:tetraacyldisaccharide 4'-kinase
MRKLLLPFSFLYGILVWLRNRAFDAGLLTTTQVGVPVVSIGNLTAGGTGKTPLVEWIAAYLLKKGKALAIISRGYGRESSGVVVVSDGSRILCGARRGGDEPVEMARTVPRARVVVGERRVEAARHAIEALNADFLLLDDGFQHRYIGRDLDILVLDSRKDITAESLLPAGVRREPLEGIRRAGLVAFSRAGASSKGRTPGWYEGPTISYRVATVSAFRAPDEQSVTVESLRLRRTFAFSGIGDHEQFVQGLRDAGLDVRADDRFPDHHVYKGADFARVSRGALAAGAEILVTTHKDHVRLLEAGAPFEELVGRHSLFYTRIAVEIVEGEDILKALLDGLSERQRA